MLSEMERAAAAEHLDQFVREFGVSTILSTGARVVDYAGVLYNVKGSTPDPHVDGKHWKRLLQSNGISGNCFADTPAARAGSSHPGFSVGGHVTPNLDGSVPEGGNCYLMPLCYWHNGKANDGKAFQHQQTRMLELSGYMRGEPAATYLARMSGAAPLSLVFLGDEGLSYRNIADEPDSAANTLTSIHSASLAGVGQFVLLRRNSDGETVTYTIEDARV
jgi:hypothetical protein